MDFRIQEHKYRINSCVLSFYTQAVRSMDLLEMVLPKEIVVTARCVTLMGYAKEVHTANFLFILSGLIKSM